MSIVWLQDSPVLFRRKRKSKNKNKKRKRKCEQRERCTYSVVGENIEEGIPRCGDHLQWSTQPSIKCQLAATAGSPPRVQSSRWKPPFLASGATTLTRLFSSSYKTRGSPSPFLTNRNNNQTLRAFENHHHVWSLREQSEGECQRREELLREGLQDRRQVWQGRLVQDQESPQVNNQPTNSLPHPFLPIQSFLFSSFPIGWLWCNYYGFGFFFFFF